MGNKNDDLVHFVRGYKLYSSTFLLLGLTLSILVHIFIPRNIKAWSKKKKILFIGIASVGLVTLIMLVLLGIAILFKSYLI